MEFVRNVNYKRWTAVLMLTALLLTGMWGCDSAPSESSNPIQPENPGTSSLTLLVDPGSPDVTLLLTQVVSADDLTVLAEQESARSSDASQEILLSGLPESTVLVQVQGVDGEGAVLASAESSVSLISGENTLDLSLSPAGRTREVGLISVSSSGTQGTGASRGPSISADGAMIVFSSTAVLAKNDISGNESIYLRNRAKLTTSLVSSKTTNPCSEPFISGDGKTIIYQEAQSGGNSLQLVSSGKLSSLTPAVGSIAGGSTTKISTGESGRVSFDGDLIVFQAQVSGSKFTQIALFEQSTSTTRILSSRAGALANGNCSSPAISPEGNRVFFSSEATNLDPSGKSGFITCTVKSGAMFARGGVSQFPCGTSKDGFQIALNFGGKLLLLDDIQNRVTEIPAGSQIEGAPSMTYAGDRIAFASSKLGLVNNDPKFRGQQRPDEPKADLYVWNRDRDEFTRVNVSADFSNVRGGASEPAIAGEGSRVAYTSLDNRLVEDETNLSEDDVYSSAVPTGGLLYATLGDGVILRYKDAAFRNGNLVPDATLRVNLGFTVPGGGCPSHLILDSSRDILYLFVNFDPTDNASPPATRSVMAMIRNASTRASGTVTPDKLVRFATTPGSASSLPLMNPLTKTDVPQIDFGKDTLTAGAQILSRTYQVSGFSTLGSEVSLQSANLQLLGANSVGLFSISRYPARWFDRGTRLGRSFLDNGASVPPVFYEDRFNGSSRSTSLALNPGPRYPDAAYVLELRQGRSLTTYDYQPDLFTGLTGGVFPVLTQSADFGGLTGSRTALGFDTYTGNVYIGVANPGRIYVVPAFESGKPQTPVRTLNLGNGGDISFVLDRTR